MTTSIKPPTSQSTDLGISRPAAADEARGALVIDGLTPNFSNDAQRALAAWIAGAMDDATLVGRMDHLRRGADLDETRAACVLARYAVALTQPIRLPASFATLRGLHHGLFAWRDGAAGLPRAAALAIDQGLPRPPDLVSNREPDRIPALADVAFRCIDSGTKLLGTSRADFVGLLTEFSTDILLLAPFAYGNRIVLRLLLTLLGQAVGRPIAFRGATHARVHDAFSQALQGDPSSLVQLLDASLRTPTSDANGTLPTVREVLLANGDVHQFADAIAKRHGISAANAPIDAFAAAVSRLSDAEVHPDVTQDLLTALGRAGILAGHDVTMLLAAHLRRHA